MSFSIAAGSTWNLVDCGAMAFVAATRRATFTRAYVKVALSEGADPEDVVRTISAHPPRVGINGEQYAQATVEEFQMKLGRANQHDPARPAQGGAQHQHAQQLGLGVMP